MRSKKILAIFATAIVLVSVLSAISIAEEQKDINNEVEMDQGTTNRFGGGDYVLIKPTKPNKDWVFGVVYGTADNPNSIILFAGQTRYLGGAEIYYDGEYKAKRGIPVYTIFAQKFIYMAEFEPNQNAKVFAEPSDLDKERPTVKPIKGIDLTNLTWTLTWIDNGTTASNNTQKTWAFSLTVENQIYTKVKDNTSIGDGMLNKLQFTFHLTASLRDVKVPNVPWYKVEVSKDGNTWKIDNSEFIGTRDYNGTAVDAKFKYDHLIEGWDFASANSRLVLETHSVYGKAIRSELMDYLKEKFMEKHRERMGMMRDKMKEKMQNFREDATVSYETESGNGTIDEANAENVNTPFLIKERRGQLTFDDNWYNVGAFRWVSDVDITNNNITEKKPVFFQIHGGKRVGIWNQAGEKGDALIGIKNNAKGTISPIGINDTKKNYYFYGFWIKGAFIYPQGEKIFHDPEFDSSAVTFDIAQEDAPAKGAKLLFALQLVIAIVVIAILLGVILWRTRRR